MVFFKLPGSTQSEPPHQWEGGLLSQANLTMHSLPLDTQILNKILFFKPKKTYRASSQKYVSFNSPLSMSRNECAKACSLRTQLSAHLLPAHGADRGNPSSWRRHAFSGEDGTVTTWSRADEGRVCRSHADCNSRVQLRRKLQLESLYGAREANPTMRLIYLPILTSSSVWAVLLWWNLLKREVHGKKERRMLRMKTVRWEESLENEFIGV